MHFAVLLRAFGRTAVPSFTVLVACAAFAGGCSGSVAQPSARDRATTASCNWYDKCGEIGAGKRYTTRDDCTTDVRAGWNNAWPAEDCTNIQSSDLDSCITAIDNTACGNGLDILNTVLNKCGKAQVCEGGEG